jgi:hypothetical protein
VQSTSWRGYARQVGVYQRWMDTRLRASGQPATKDLGNTLEHGFQRDAVACGVYALSTLRHIYIGEELVTPTSQRRARMRYFVELAQAHNEEVLASMYGS